MNRDNKLLNTSPRNRGSDLTSYCPNKTDKSQSDCWMYVLIIDHVGVVVNEWCSVTHLCGEVMYYDTRIVRWARHQWKVSIGWGSRRHAKDNYLINRRPRIDMGILYPHCTNGLIPLSLFYVSIKYQNAPNHKDWTNLRHDAIKISLDFFHIVGSISRMDTIRDCAGVHHQRLFMFKLLSNPNWENVQGNGSPTPNT